jgi:sigma-B regulation protein RsbU (phosphoserine phosphatase)
MTTATHADYRAVLADRRDQLTRAAREVPSADVRSLLAEVDDAIARLERGTYGVCEVCHEWIGAGTLGRDPMARCCLEHLTAAEQARLGRDLALARDLQRGFLPRAGLAAGGWQYRYRYEPASEVGGDFCDVIPLPARDETLVLVGDVSGKGVAASLVMASLVGMFRSTAPLGLPAGDLLTRINDLFRASAPTSLYATLAAASLKPGGIVDLYSAGHWPPILGRFGLAAPVEVTGGLPLGFRDDSRYEPTRVELGPGETLLFFTDGAIDAENDAGDNYGARRLARALGAADGAELDALVDDCLKDVRAFQNGRQLDDDLLLFAVRARAA